MFSTQTLLTKRPVNHQINPMSDGVGSVTPSGMALTVKGKDFPLSEFARNRLYAELGLPRPLMDNLCVERPRLAHDLLQHRWKKDMKPMQLRTRSGTGIGLVSPNHLDFDHADMLRALGTEIARMAVDERRGSGALSCNVFADADTDIYVRVRSKMLEREVKRGDIVGFGYEARNSEVGKASASVQVFALRLVCTNGLVIPSGNGISVAVRHVAGQSIVDRNRRRAEIGDQLRRAAAKILTDQLANQMTDKLRTLTAIELMGNIQLEAFIDFLTEHAVASPSEAKALCEAHGWDRWETAWDVLNGVTAYAQTRETGARMELERAAAALIDLPTQEWASL